MGGALDLFTLGGLRIMLEHEPVTQLRSRTAEALLVYLVCQGRPIPREWLAEFFYPERPHETSLVNLRVALHRLNKTLAPHLVVTRRSVGLRDDHLPYVDRADFERLLAQGQLREALGLYRGDFLRGFHLPGSPAFEVWADDERDRLHELAVGAYQELALQHAARAETDEAIRLARGLLQLEPFHEPTQRLLLRLLAQSGRRQAAIEGFEGFRSRLRDDLGFEPEEESLTLLEQVRSGVDVEVPGGDRATPTAPASHLDVPYLSTPLLGRQAELETLRSRFAQDDCRLVSVVAPGGMGKTLLAVEAARQMSEDFADGVCFVPLAGIMSPDGIASAVVHGLSLTLPPGSDAKAGILAYLRARRMLLLFDNFDELLEGAPLLLEILHHAPEVKLLVTSRERLALSEEWLLPLAGLEVDEAAMELFVQRAMRVAPDLDPVEEGEAIRELCRLVEGMPLAIELAASWAGIMTCETITQEVRASLDFLTADGPNDLPARHRSMRGVFETSWGLLTPEAQAVLMRLSPFRGGFAAPEAQAVAGATYADLRSLVGQSLLRMDGRGRFALHELIRQHAAEKLRAAGEAEATAGRHFDAYLALAEAAEPEMFGSQQPKWLTRLEIEWENFGAALAHGFGGGREAGAAVRLVLALSWFWRRGAFHEARHWLDRALQLDGSPAQLRPALLSHAGHVAWMQGRWDVAEAELEESLALWIEQGLGFEHDAARTRCSLAMTRYMQGRFEDARPLLEDALAVFRSNGSEWWIAFALAFLGKTAVALQEYERAETCLSEGLAIYRRIGNRWGLGLFLITAAQLELAIGALQEARVLAEEARTLLLEIGHKHALGEAYRMLGEIHWAEGRPIDAEANYRHSIATYREIGQESFAGRVEAELAGREL
jgi:predicted ATPase/DNA-binding SARP family transcriptional activator